MRSTTIYARFERWYPNLRHSQEKTLAAWHTPNFWVLSPRALNLSSEAAAHDDNAARARLSQIEVENDIKQRSLDLRERKIDTQARERERALADARDHLLSLSKAPASRRPIKRRSDASPIARRRSRSIDSRSDR